MTSLIIIYILLALSLYQVHKCMVLQFKNAYYKQKLDNRGIESSVEDVKTIIDIIKR